jgi:hypothetical protein
MTEEELQHMKQTLHDVCGVLLRFQIDMQAKADLRDQFAMAALTGIASRDGMSSADYMSRLAYELADAMMEARK